MFAVRIIDKCYTNPINITTISLMEGVNSVFFVYILLSTGTRSNLLQE